VRKRFSGRKRRNNKRVEAEEQKPSASPAKKSPGGHGAFYKSGPVLVMPGLFDGPGSGARKNNAEESSADGKQMTTLLNSLRAAPPATLQVSGKGEQSQDSAKATSVRLEGRTDVNFDGGRFETKRVRVSAAKGCNAGTKSDPCVRARGVLVARYRVVTKVILPSVNDYPELTPCQRTRMQQAIDTVLVPHEQQHVKAFQKYNGVTRTPFDLTLRRSEFNSTIQSMFDKQESARRAAAQAASDALDPFHIDVDLDCEEPPEDDSSSNGDAENSEAAGDTEQPFAPGAMENQATDS
jgi:hypothetical protein